jgi:hypothetical protein
VSVHELPVQDLIDHGDVYVVVHVCLLEVRGLIKTQAIGKHGSKHPAITAIVLTRDVLGEQVFPLLAGPFLLAVVLYQLPITNYQMASSK